METVILDLVNLSSVDLQDNLNGLISDKQRSILMERRIESAVKILLLILLGTALMIALLVKVGNPSFASRGEFLIGLPIGLFWLWLLRLSPLLWRQTNRELREGRITVMEGQVQCEIRGNIGLVQVPHYLVQIDGHVFQTTRQIYYQFKNREYYRVFYTPFSETLLGGMQVNVPAENDMQVHSGIEEFEIFSAQEKELLRLIAAGFSNKQIALELAFSVNTVKMYISNLYRKLGVHKRTEAVVRARQLHLL